eukprot:scaffold73801_cov20-Tisochrysis_lutea.AAC.2
MPRTPTAARPPSFLRLGAGAHHLHLMHICLQVPQFNAHIFLENKTQVGKVEEILGPINNVVGRQTSVPTSCPCLMPWLQCA